MPGTTWLVTGAAGFLGMNAGLWLGDRVTRVGQTRGTGQLGPFDQQVAMDLRDGVAAGDLVRALRPDVVLNTAAISGHETCDLDPAQARAVNVDAARHLSQAAAEVGSRIIHISTDAVFDGSRGGYRETDAVSPFSLYGETKLAGEKAVLESGAEALVLRTNFFGWSSSGRRSVLEFFVNSLREGLQVKGYPDFVVTSLYVRTLLDVIWRLNEGRATGLFHVASADAMSKYDFGVQIARTFGLDPQLIASMPSTQAMHSTSRSRDLSLNTDLVQSTLGLPMQDQAEGIAQAKEEEVVVAGFLRSFDKD